MHTAYLQGEEAIVELFLESLTAHALVVEEQQETIESRWRAWQDEKTAATATSRHQVIAYPSLALRLCASQASRRTEVSLGTKGIRLKAVEHPDHYHFIPLERPGEMLADLYGQALGDATILAASEEMAEQIEPVQAAAKEHLQHTLDPVHFDETGMRVEGHLGWTHLASPAEVTHLAVYDKRGEKALNNIGIFAHQVGKGIHNDYSLYLQFLRHGAWLGHTHHLRELVFIHEQYGQSWAKEFTKLLVQIKDSVELA